MRILQKLFSIPDMSSDIIFGSLCIVGALASGARVLIGVAPLVFHNLMQ